MNPFSFRARRQSIHFLLIKSLDAFIRLPAGLSLERFVFRTRNSIRSHAIARWTDLGRRRSVGGVVGLMESGKSSERRRRRLEKPTSVQLGQTVERARDSPSRGVNHTGRR